MVKKPARYAATNENLIEHALEPAMRWLIATALDGTTMTYGDMKDRLEREASFLTVFPTRIGVVAGELMHKIQEVEPVAPCSWSTKKIGNRARAQARSWRPDFRILG
jgi:hypothetical protein